MAAAADSDSGRDSRSDDDRSSSEWSSNGFEGSSSRENASEHSSQVAVDEQLPMSPGQAAAIIQGMYRQRKARGYFVDCVRQAYEKVYDEQNDVYFYYSKLHGTSQWSAPRVLLGRPLDPREEWAATKIQAAVRKRRSWKKLISMLNDVYEKEYDPDTDAWFYVNKVTKLTSWTKPSLFYDREPPTNTSDAALMNKDREIEELRRELEGQINKAEEARKALQDKITEEKVRNGELDPDESKGRSRHMDEWDVETVVAWFHSVGYTQHDAGLREHQVDGLLLLHLMNEDWAHLGITSPLTVRRLDVAMQTYRARFERKQEGGVEGMEDASDGSASDTPSELLDDDDMYDDDDDESLLQDGEEAVTEVTGDAVDDNELAELQKDKENITKEIIFEGEDNRGQPVVGDVVRIHYSCALQRGGRGGGEGAVVENSRKNRRRPMEFVVGLDQVVKGVDRVVRSMRYGERAKVSITAAYAYGAKGYPPIIPPGAALVFDINILDFWPRPRWQKPLVQVMSAPYAETPFAPRLEARDDEPEPGAGKEEKNTREGSRSK